MKSTMKTLRIIALCLLASYGFAQQKLSKTSQSIKVNKDVEIDLNTSYVELEIDTWNKDIVEIEAYIESDKLSEEELKQALEDWKLDVDATNGKVIISTQGGRGFGLVARNDYDNLLRDLEFELANIPDVPELGLIPEPPQPPNLPDIPEVPELPKMPEIPEIPELPELPDGIKSITFDYDKYQKEGEKYLAEWSKRYEKEGGKELQKAMEKWAKKFAASGYQKKMQKWGEDYAKRFEGDWTEQMEAWGEKFGDDYAKQMEVWGEKYGKEWAERMEAWAERLEKQLERKEARLSEQQARSEEREAMRAEREAQRAQLRAEREAFLAKRNQEVKERQNALVVRGFKRNSSDKVRKVIKLRIPKKAKLNMNVRHGELKISSLLHNAQGNISHSFLEAEYIDGGDTSINVAYSPVLINTWNLGTLNLNFVDKAQIKKASSLVLNSKSSNVLIETLDDTGIIDGSFGDLTISNLTDSFKTLNLVLENSDALVNLPKDVNYNLYFNGSRSKLNNKTTAQKTIRHRPNSDNSERTVMVNAKFSDVIIN